MSISYGGDTIIDSNGGVLRPSSSVMRNRIINGAMVIDQRNAGALVSPALDSGYTLDRWEDRSSSAGAFSIQQVTDAPVGFIKSLKVVSLAATSLAAGAYYWVSQGIEGYNFSDLGFGTAAAKTITISFWVKSSLTGNFGGTFRSGGNDRYCPFSYTISVANTWTYCSVTLPGDTSGTWPTDNSAAAWVYFMVGTGTNFQGGTSGVWGSTAYFAPTGSVNVVATSGDTWNLTGVQLEVGSSATGFEYRQYGQELALCQRYYTFGENTTYISAATGSIVYNVPFLVYMRTAPTVTKTGNFWTGAENGTTVASITNYNFVFSNSGAVASGGTWTATAEL